MKVKKKLHLKKIKEHFEEKKKQRRRRRLTIIILCIIIILLLLLRCSCAEPQKGPAAKPSPSPVVKAVSPKKTPRPPQRPRKNLQVKPDARPVLDPGQDQEPAWLEAFRQQARARTHRLTECLANQAGYGGVKWFTVVNLKSGETTAHVFEPIGEMQEFGPEELKCMKEVLSRQTYTLERFLAEKSETKTLPVEVKVSLVFEF